MYIEILRATITKTIQRDMLKSTTYKSTEFLKDVQVAHRKTGKENQKSDDRPKEKINNNIIVLSSNIVIINLNVNSLNITINSEIGSELFKSD